MLLGGFEAWVIWNIKPQLSSYITHLKNLAFYFVRSLSYGLHAYLLRLSVRTAAGLKSLNCQIPSSNVNCNVSVFYTLINAMQYRLERKVMRNLSKTQKGFSLLEMFGVLVVSSILASLGVPMVSDIKNSSEGETLQDEFARSLAEARNLAVSTGDTVFVCASGDGEACTSGEWSNGWLVYSGDRMADGEVVAEGNRINATHIENDELEVSVFDEALNEVADIRFNNQGFNGAKTKVSAEVCSSSSNLLSESVLVERSGRIRIATREDLNTHLKVSCS